jgi:anti-sigma factor RsiW
VKSMRACKLLDKYRDGELSSAERNDFESHLAACEGCRMTMSLLNNVVHLIKAEEVRPLDMADRIARQAFQRAHSWDFEIISWLRPGPALAALTLMAVLFSSVWMITGNRQVSVYSEYEKLIDEADAVNLGTSLSQVQNNSEFSSWLEQGGNSE